LKNNGLERGIHAQKGGFVKERIIRMELPDLEKLLRKQGTIKKNEYLNDAHIEPNELVIRLLAEDKKKGDKN
jgi:hypothetical protein